MAKYFRTADSICKVLGLDPNYTGTITIRFEPNSAPMVIVESFIPSEGEQEMERLLTEYILVPRPAPPAST